MSPLLACMTATPAAPLCSPTRRTACVRGDDRPVLTASTGPLKPDFFPSLTKGRKLVKPNWNRFNPREAVDQGHESRLKSTETKSRVQKKKKPATTSTTCSMGRNLTPFLLSLKEEGFKPADEPTIVLVAAAGTARGSLHSLHLFSDSTRVTQGAALSPGPPHARELPAGHGPAPDALRQLYRFGWDLR